MRYFWVLFYKYQQAVNILPSAIDSYIRPSHAVANSYTRSNVKPVFAFFFAFYAVLLLNVWRPLYFEWNLWDLQAFWNNLSFMLSSKLVCLYLKATGE